ncbi:hypothetical protein HYFRA_00009880 [Hymenoscyphus fraxineus]|uniref:Uncharacterized protein n=1 Tax=Hymenoscyphus fraxineus TaxID=746836 RepID=A0A9N9L5L5_9HELO|nr:hypothetical protein HYFRA_00009880 [Hymenoscyphus fraxineus]
MQKVLPSRSVVAVFLTTVLMVNRERALGPSIPTLDARCLWMTKALALHAESARQGVVNIDLLLRGPARV